jgi:hypothetical protein
MSLRWKTAHGGRIPGMQRRGVRREDPSCIENRRALVLMNHKARILASPDCFGLLAFAALIARTRKTNILSRTTERIDRNDLAVARNSLEVGQYLRMLFFHLPHNGQPAFSVRTPGMCRRIQASYCTSAAIPAAKCHRMWQWRYQSPGLLASNSTVTVVLPGTSMVSRNAPVNR